MAAPHAELAARRAPHGSMVERVAITDEGDAAVSTDSLGGMRLWPTLDGKAEPRVIAGGAARQLAIAHVGRELLVASVDSANGLVLHRLGSDGASHGRADIGPEPGIELIVALGDGVLGLGRDQVVRRYAATGAVGFALAAEPGEHIAALAARRGSAIAIFDAGDAPTVVRAIELAPAPHWGPRIALPMAVRAVSLSPSHARVAAVKRVGGDGVVIELAPAPRAIGAVSLVAPAGTKVWSGFVDDDHAVFTTAQRMSWWGGKPPPKDVTIVGAATELATGDRAAIAGQGAGLAVIDPETWRHLGYRDIGAVATTTVGSRVVLSSGTGLLWLDARLRVLRATPDPTVGERDDVSPYAALDDRLYVVAHTSNPVLQGEPRVEVALADLDGGAPRPLVSVRSLGGVVYDPSSRMLVLQGEDRMIRYTIDDHGTTHPRSALRLTDSIAVVPLDPAAAHGTVAVAMDSTAEGVHLLAFHDGDTAELDPATRVTVEGSLLGVARDGTAFVVRPDRRIDVFRDGKRGASIAVPGTGASSGAVSHDGTALALIDGDVFAIDIAGRERWRRQIWRPLALHFFDDDRAVLVSTQGGLVVLDAATGAPLATGCGWRFGLHDHTYEAVYGVETVCE